MSTKRMNLKITFAEKKAMISQKLAEAYLEQLRNGELPPLLRAIVSRQRPSIVRAIDDTRVSVVDAINDIFYTTHFIIHQALTANLELRARLRKLRDANQPPPRTADVDLV